ncbi:MAG: protein kinase domain-containing protein [Noviherbaspirillum sp.]
MEYDDDKTAVRKPSGRPPPGAPPGAAPDKGSSNESSQNEGSPNVLPAGTRLAEFEILDLIGEGGFGIVYLAYDHTLNRRVALKEYMPSGMASRGAGLLVTVRSRQHADTFAAGLKSFVNEARLLAQFDSPSLVKVYRFWEANRTAYMVMPYYDGITLKEAFRQRRIVPDEAWIKGFLTHLLGAVETIHRVQCYHRDIAPDNILLLKDGRPLLLDFGAARRVIGDLTQGPTVILKPGYAPIEQYAEIPGLRQGPWTDVYAIAAVAYFLMTGKTPPPAVARIVNDEMVPARQAARGRYSDYFLAAIDVALAVKPEHRIQSVANLRRALDIGDITSSRAASAAAPNTAEGGTRPRPEAATRANPTQAGPGPAMRPPPPGASTTPWPRPLMSDSRDLAGQRRHGALEWVAFAVLLSAGIAGGFYWGANQFSFPMQLPFSLPWQAAQPSGGDAPAPAVLAREERAAESTGTPAAPPQAAPPSAAAPAVAAPSSPDATARLPARPENPVPAEPPPLLARGQPAQEPQTRAAPEPRPSPEDVSWNAAAASNQSADYQAYLAQYPNGRHAAAARSRIERLQKAAVAPAASEPAVPPTASRTAPPPERSAADEEWWQAASAMGKASAYEAYLSKYPAGRYAGLARDRLATARHAESVTASADQADASRGPAASSGSGAAAAEPGQETARSDRVPQPPAQVASAPSARANPSAASGTQAGQATGAAGTAGSAQRARPSAPDTQVAAIPPSTGMPDAGPPRATRVIRLANQTMTGDFIPDPATGVVSGRGRIEWANGDRFEGTLVNGRKEGQGVFVWNNGQRYRGQWSNDQPNGSGALTFPNGNRYEGGIRDGLPHGDGVTRFTSGDVHQGRYAGGKMQGQGRYTWANGSYWEGDFRNDQRSGEGKLVFSEKALEQARAVARAPASAPQAAGGGEGGGGTGGQE